MEGLPQTEEFICYSNLSPEEVIKRLKTVTIVPRSFATNKTYLGILKKDSFKISNNKPRKVYGTVLPMSPFLKFMPKFIQGKIYPDGTGSKIEISFQIGNAAKGGNILALFVFLFPFIIAIAVLIAFWALGVFNNMNTAPNPNRKEGYVQIFRVFGTLFTLAIFIAIKNIFDVKKYKNKYQQIVEIERGNMLKLFEAVPAGENLV